MAYQFPKHILEEGAEIRIDKINNTWRRTMLALLKDFLKDEYDKVLEDLVFGPILVIVDNKLIYSGKIIHSFICKQLKVSKLHELWFEFANRPLKFSMQEFHAVTGLKFEEEPDIEFKDWNDDKGLWSKTLRQNVNINLYSIRDELLKVCHTWTYVDRVRLVYLCIIHGFIMAKDWKVYIPQEYIRLVMDFDKMRMYPWGLRAYDELISSILKARTDLHLKNSYVLDGFSYAKDQEKLSQCLGPSATVGIDEVKSSLSPRPSAGKGSGSAAESVDPHALRRSPRTVRKVTTT